MNSRLRSGISALFLAAAPFIVQATARGADWPTFDGNASRSAWLRDDRSVNPQNVASLRRHWVTTLDNVADSTPIYVERPKGRFGATAPMLFETDGKGTTYGIDATTGAIVWRFKTTGPGITASTPVVDSAGSDIYVPGVDGYVHKVSMLTGAEVKAPGFPVQITLTPTLEKDASPLNVANGYFYAATSGYIGDAPPYDGHVVTVRLSDGTTNVFNSLCSNLHKLLTGADCSSVRSGVWARAGVVVDPDTSQKGQAYFSTGNGPFTGKYDFGDSAISLSADGSSMVGSFTPSDHSQLKNQDLDLGSTAPAMLPGITNSKTPLLAVQGGKGQLLYLLDRTHLGGVGGQLQSFRLPGELFTAPAVWRNGAGQTLIFLGLLPDSTDVMALAVSTDGQGRTRVHLVWTAAVGGTSPVATDGLVFVAASGAVTALDARNGSSLWSSTAQKSGGTIGGIHWQSPIVVNGGVYISDNNGHLTAYTINGK